MKKPFSTYNGGKNGNGTYQQIINHIPKCDLFIDAMVGNGGIVTNLSLPGLTVINDIDKNVIDGFDVSGSSTRIIKENMSYSSIIDKYDGKVLNTVFYFDPPYLKDTRKSSRNLYANDWETLDHVKFLFKATEVKSNAMISHYPCPMYDDYLASWNKHDFVSMTRAGLRTERIYMNYPMPTVLQDFRYVGDNYRERQRIKRKIGRLMGKFESLPIDERTALISAVIVKYSDTAVSLTDHNNIVKNNFQDLHTILDAVGHGNQLKLI